MLKTQTHMGNRGRLRSLAFLCLLGATFFAVADEASKSAEKATLIQPLLIGAKAPEARLADNEGQVVKLSEILARQPTVLVFFRGGW